ncbi:hypothetical protein HALA3H3_p20036 [Halomonas sp. A3H3]|nr:hypothetical protein HALA3H3_p20036 [Halomonas sp. A3H3]
MLGKISIRKSRPVELLELDVSAFDLSEGVEDAG